MTPRIGSLCSGYGGLDLGLMAVVGGSVAWHVEYDKHPSAVLDARFPGVPNYGDLTTTDWTQVEPVDWLTAGYPCQPFSHAGKRKGKDDERHLWPHVADAIRVLRPRRVLLENVAGHLSLGFGQVLGDLAEAGYDADWICLRASDAGAPHGRARVFIVASDADGGSLSRPAVRGNGLRRGELAPDADGVHERAVAAGDRRGEPEGASRDSRGPIAHAHGAGGEARRGRPGAGDAGRLQPVVCGAAPAGDPQSDPRGLIDGEPSGIDWGAFGPAVRRWETILGRPAPAPTVRNGRGGNRLSPWFVEWMMGLPSGWVADVLSISPALKCLGNGVVPQQAALALSALLPSVEVAA